MLHPRKPISTLEAYRSPLNRAGLNLDLNENTMGCSERVLARLKSLTSRDVTMYPDRAAGERFVANFLGVPAEQVFLTNGIDDGLLLLSAAYLGETDEMLLADPTFVMYPIYGQATGARVVRVQAGADFTFPTDEILAAITPHTRLITIANPNNPTGTLVPQADLLRIIHAAPNAAALVDEAYFDFGGETLLPQVQRFPNLFIARTFSKAYGLAGLRLGVLIGPTPQVELLRRFCSPFNVNAVALACMEEALADQEFVQRYVSEVKQGRDRVASLCAELGLKTWPSHANFLLVHMGENSRNFVSAMSRRGISVRGVSSNPGCDGCVRITIGTSTQMDGVLRAMRETVAELNL